jgi:DNA-directed RNA polymerase specialized sigma24 family protein
MRATSPPPSGLHELVLRCQAGEAVAWEALAARVRRLVGRVLGRGFRSLGPADRSDVAAAVLKRLVPAVGQGRITGRSDGEIEAYLRAMLRNGALDLLDWRRVRGETPLSDDLPVAGPDPERQAIVAQHVARVRALVGAWPEEDRLLFLMKLEGATATAIRLALARLTGVHLAAPTIDVRYHRLRRKLQHGLGEDAS